MTSKIILGAIVAVAFLAGTITTGAVAYAAAGGQGDNLIADAIDRLSAIMETRAVTGPPGPNFPSTYTVTDTVIASPDGFAVQIVLCDNRDTVLGGGVSANSEFADIFINSPDSFNNPTGWSGAIHNPSDGFITMRTTVICADTTQ